MWSLASAAVVLALASAPPAGSAESAPVRVVASTSTRLELAVRLLDEPGNLPSPTIRELVLERMSEGQPWRLVRGLAEGEIAGPARLATVTPDGRTNPFRRLSPEIAASVGEGVTLVDLPEGDAALCIWSGGKVHEAWFIDRLFPDLRQAMGRSGSRTPADFLWKSFLTVRPLPPIRECIALCVSNSRAYAEAAGQKLAAGSPGPGSASTRDPGPALQHALEASEAAFAFGQVGVDPPDDAATDLYRWIMADAAAAFASTSAQRTLAPLDQAARAGTPSRDPSDSTAETVPDAKGLP